MGRYIARRLLIAVPTLLAISFVMYAILALAPIDPLSQFGADPRIPPEARDQIRHALGLDQPWPIRYLKWIQGMATGNFGYSFMSHSPVIELLLQRLPNTLAVVGVAYIVGFLIALPIGVFSAVRRNSIADHVFSTFAYFGFSVPTFFTGLVLIIIFSVKLHWLPFVYDSNLKINDFGSLVAQLRQSIMPIAVLGFFEAAVLTRYIRAEMLEHLPLDYVRTARAKGLLERFVVIRHVLRNSLIPVVTIIALGVPAIFGGAIVTEQVFHVPGIGELLVRSIFQGDTPVVTAVLMIFAVLVVAFNLLADVLYAALDPRIRYS
ncbi:MAG: ABC transporter permease [Chloroflexi bacterium]|nr:MAG: ABC transporter permease [Chloroflexota bacterium]TMB94595.1 MAG: ABC transporter permease [Chloroflexota bacterium]TMC31073.1 MAG: ABC transporter permease [Chloroflexota bacterium]TMC33264.1 MAG: ABC transporter permease [Chloroflexota bacterium]TMC56261.1 MAG: ABC transporter permease [Chloroflexota bacterium]